MKKLQILIVLFVMPLIAGETNVPVRVEGHFRNSAMGIDIVKQVKNIIMHSGKLHLATEADSTYILVEIKDTKIRALASAFAAAYALQLSGTHAPFYLDQHVDICTADSMDIIRAATVIGYQIKVLRGEYLKHVMHEPIE